MAGQVSVVTGGALGMGGEISRRLAAAGAHVVLADVDADPAAAALDSIVGAGGACTVVVGDIRDRDVVAAVTETALAVDDSRVDILVNNVGDFRPAAKTFLHSAEEQWQTLYELNLLHVLRMCHALLPDLADTPQTPAQLMLRGREPDLIKTWIPAASGWYARADGKGWTNMPNEA